MSLPPGTFSDDQAAAYDSISEMLNSAGVDLDDDALLKLQFILLLSRLQDDGCAGYQHRTHQADAYGDEQDVADALFVSHCGAPSV